jgi:hypothetical protein
MNQVFTIHGKPYILTDGYLYRAAPNMLPRKDARGNRYAEQDGWAPEGIPLMRVTNDWNNPLLALLLSHDTPTCDVAPDGVCEALECCKDNGRASV